MDGGENCEKEDNVGFNHIWHFIIICGSGGEKQISSFACLSMWHPDYSLSRRIQTICRRDTHNSLSHW